MILEGKVAAVTGGGNGIGREVSKLLAQEGAKVVVNDLGVAVDGAGGTQAAADGVVTEIQDAGGSAVASYDSVATPEGGQAIIQTALHHFGKIDIVVHVAGILRDRMLFNMSIEEWDAVINVHLRGAFCIIRPAAALMRAQKSGRIIAFSSGSAAGQFGQAKLLRQGWHPRPDPHCRTRFGQVWGDGECHLAVGCHTHDRDRSRGSDCSAR